MPAHAQTARGPGRLTKLYVAVLLGAFVATPLLAEEHWPLTSWKLFSGSRPQIEGSWRVVVVDRSGAEHVVGGRGFVAQLAPRFAGRPKERAGLCRGWARIAVPGGDARQVRLVRREIDLALHADRKSPPPADERVAFTCAADGSAIRRVPKPAAGAAR